MNKCTNLKKSIGCLVIIATLTAGWTLNAAPSNGTSLNQLYSKYALCTNAESVNIGNFLIKLARFIVAVSEDEADSAETDIALKTLSNLNGIKVLSLESCSKEDQDNFRRDARRCDTDGYSLLTSIRDGEDLLDIYLVGEDDIFTEMVVLSSGQDPALIWLEGRMTMDEIKVYINDMQ